MRQRSHALGLRLSDCKGSWDSTWFAPHSGGGRSARIHRDQAIRNWVEQVLKEYGVITGRIFVQEVGGDSSLHIGVEYYLPRGLRHWSWRRRYSNKNRLAGFRYRFRRKSLFRLLAVALQRGLGNRPIVLKLNRLDSILRSRRSSYSKPLQSVIRYMYGHNDRLQGRRGEHSDAMLIYILSMVTRNPNLILHHVIHQLESTQRHWGVFHKTRKFAERLLPHCFWIKGIRLRIAGRMLGRLRKSSSSWQVGICPLNNMDYSIEVGQAVARTTKFGSIGLTLWISHQLKRYFPEAVISRFLLGGKSLWVRRPSLVQRLEALPPLHFKMINGYSRLALRSTFSDNSGVGETLGSTNSQPYDSTQFPYTFNGEYLQRPNHSPKARLYHYRRAGSSLQSKSENEDEQSQDKKGTEKSKGKDKKGTEKSKGKKKPNKGTKKAQPKKAKGKRGRGNKNQ
jgi:hypothetical protein